jgi:hypothetical protein
MVPNNILLVIGNTFFSFRKVFMRLSRVFKTSGRMYNIWFGKYQKKLPVMTFDYCYY